MRGGEHSSWCRAASHTISRTAALPALVSSIFPCLATSSRRCPASCSGSWKTRPNARTSNRSRANLGGRAVDLMRGKILHRHRDGLVDRRLLDASLVHPRRDTALPDLGVARG